MLLAIALALLGASSRAGNVAEDGLENGIAIAGGLGGAPWSARPFRRRRLQPLQIECGGTYTGDYEGEPITFQLTMEYFGDVTLDASASDFEIGSITAYDSDDNGLTDVDARASVNTVHDVDQGQDYTFILEGAVYFSSGTVYFSSGTYDIIITCDDKSTGEPSGQPSAMPTVACEPCSNDSICSPGKCDGGGRKLRFGAAATGCCRV